MPVTVIAQITLNEAVPEKLAAYFKVTTPLLAQAGAIITNRFDINEIVVGSGGAKTVIIVEYPNRDAVSQVFDSPQYASIWKMRDEAFSHYQISICETMSTAPTEHAVEDYINVDVGEE